jgi:hypothetical protein
MLDMFSFNMKIYDGLKTPPTKVLRFMSCSKKHSSYANLMFVWPCIVDIMEDKDQLDATKCWFTLSTCFVHYYAHLQEYNGEYRFLVSKPSGFCSAGLLDVCAAQRMWPHCCYAVHSFISIQPLGQFGRNQSPVRRPVWLWYTAY